MLRTLLWVCFYRHRQALLSSGPFFSNHQAPGGSCWFTNTPLELKQTWCNVYSRPDTQSTVINIDPFSISFFPLSVCSKYCRTSEWSQFESLSNVKWASPLVFGIGDKCLRMHFTVMGPQLCVGILSPARPLDNIRGARLIPGLSVSAQSWTNRAPWGRALARRQMGATDVFQWKSSLHACGSCTTAHGA